MSTQASEVSARPVKARRSQTPLRIKARYGSVCGNCGKTGSVGETIGRLPRALTRYGDPGWVCLRCQGASVILEEPTLQNVVARIYLRWACGKPVSLNKSEVRTLAMHVLAADPELKPERRCERREAEAVSRRRRRGSRWISSTRRLPRLSGTCWTRWTSISPVTSAPIRRARFSPISPTVSFLIPKFQLARSAHSKQRRSWTVGRTSTGEIPFGVAGNPPSPFCTRERHYQSWSNCRALSVTGWR